MTAGPKVDVTLSQAETGMTCPICRGAMHRALAGVGDPQSGEAFDVVRCSRCQLGITVPAPEDLERVEQLLRKQMS